LQALSLFYSYVKVRKYPTHVVDLYRAPILEVPLSAQDATDIGRLEDMSASLSLSVMPNPLSLGVPGAKLYPSSSHHHPPPAVAAVTAPALQDDPRVYLQRALVGKAQRFIYSSHRLPN
jgi:hypothetical protein